MEKIIIIMLIITLGIFIYMYFTLRSQIKDITAQLDFIEKNRSNALITIRVKAGGSKALAAALNEMLENHRAERVMWKKKENEISCIYTNLSHDIRTPLTSLDGYFQLLSESEDKEKNKRYKKAIVPELKLTEEKLYFYGNEQMMHRILQNIIKNVLEHGEKKVEICLNSIKNEIRLTIQNEVTKPDEIDISRIFERFYKADVVRSKTSTGLGMAIAKEMTEDMGGKIEAELNDNIFKVSLFFKRL